MKEAAWRNLVNLYPEASGLAIGDICGLRFMLIPPRVSFRTSYRTHDSHGVEFILKKYRLFDRGFNKNGDFQNEYDVKSINGDKVVIDDATGLMWHQNGSDEDVSWNVAKDWVRSLRYAGYNDWRLPTVEEAASLLESSKSNDLYIDSVFSNKQSYV